MVSAVEQAKRALVSLLKWLATAYKCVLDVTRDSSDQEVKSAYRKLSKKTHPDKGGREADQMRLNIAYEKWQQEVQKAPGRGRSRAPEAEAKPEEPVNSRSNLAATTQAANSKRQEFRIASEAVLLTFQGFGDASRWQ